MQQHRVKQEAFGQTEYPVAPDHGAEVSAARLEQIWPDVLAEEHQLARFGTYWRRFIEPGEEGLKRVLRLVRALPNVEAIAKELEVVPGALVAGAEKLL